MDDRPRLIRYPATWRCTAEQEALADALEAKRIAAEDVPRAECDAVQEELVRRWAFRREWRKWAARRQAAADGRRRSAASKRRS